VLRFSAWNCETSILLSLYAQLLYQLSEQLTEFESPVAPFVKRIVDAFCKLFIGEDFKFASDLISERSNGFSTDFAEDKGKFYRPNNIKTIEDEVDLLWANQKANTLILQTGFWSVKLDSVVRPYFKAIMTELGHGNAKYIVLQSYLR